MKIIAKNEDRKYVCYLDEEELAHIVGHDRTYSNGFNALVTNAMKYHTNIPVSRIFRQHQAIKNIKYGNRVKDARNKLLEMAEILKPIEELIIEIPTVINE
jgi:endonuclease V-like protein UPF0215 family